MSLLSDFASTYDLEVKDGKIQGPKGHISLLPFEGPPMLQVNVPGEASRIFLEDSPVACESALREIGLRPQEPRKVRIQKRRSTGTYVVRFGEEPLIVLRAKHQAIRLARALRRELEKK